MGEILKTTRVLAACATLLVALYFWKTGEIPLVSNPPPPPPKTDQQVATEEDLRYLTAIIAHRFGNTQDDKPKLLAGLAAKRTAKELNKSFKAVFRESLEQLPPGSSAKSIRDPFFGITIPLYVRQIDTVESLRKGKPLASSREIARRVLEEPEEKLVAKLSPAERCVTTFHDEEGASPAWDSDVQKIRDATRALTLPNGSFFACMEFPKKKEEK